MRAERRPIRRTVGSVLAVSGVAMLVSAATLGLAPAGAGAPSDPVTTAPTSEATPTVEPSPTTDPTATPTSPQQDATELTDAVLRWGVNDESNNRAFAPDTYNFFSAGRVPDPGRGGQQIARGAWRQSRGTVSIEKWNGRAWRPATWAGLRTTAAGAPLGSPTAGTFSDHSFVFRGGNGVVDRGSGTARIQWDGDVTVLYYSGMSFFHVADPVLTVADGSGTLTATVSGFASSIDNPGAWAPVPARRVTLADLPDVDLGDDRGFVAEPAYLGVRVNGVPQRLDVPAAGAFPQSYVDYMDRLGTAAFWYSSGAATDPFKVAHPVTISYDASNAVAGPTPSPGPTSTPVDNPTAAPPPAVADPPPVAAPVAPPAKPAPPLAATAAPAAVSGLIPRPPTELRLAAGAPVAPPATTRRSWPWWAGGSLLLVAAALLLVPAGRPVRR